MSYRVVIEDYPPDVDGYVVESLDDNGEPFYTICINAKLNDTKQRATFFHEMLHIEGQDFDCECTDEMEEKRHEEIEKLMLEFSTQGVQYGG